LAQSSYQVFTSPKSPIAQLKLVRDNFPIRAMQSNDSMGPAIWQLIISRTWWAFNQLKDIRSHDDQKYSVRLHMVR